MVPGEEPRVFTLDLNGPFLSASDGATASAGGCFALIDTKRG